MIIKGFKTLSELEHKLRAVPAEKRKVIVLVGRHPNEGTINIAQRHHKSWEQHSVVVVRIPAEWTPLYLWKKALRQNLSLLRARELHDAIPTDFDVVEFLQRQGFRVPVVNFHGTTNYGGGIKFEVGSRSEVHDHLLFERIPENGQHPCELLAEFRHIGSGKDIGRQDIVAEVQRRYCFQARPGLQPAYLADSSMGKNGVGVFALFDRIFQKNSAELFEQVLAHLARTGLRKY